MFLTSETGNDIITSYDYFPYGKKIELAHTSEGAVTQTFTGKELDRYDEDLDIGADGEGWYYFGARYYDADIGMWASCDPKGQYWSPFTYGNNSPVIRIDPDGNEDYLFLYDFTNPLTNVGELLSRGFGFLNLKDANAKTPEIMKNVSDAGLKVGIPLLSYGGSALTIAGVATAQPEVAGLGLLMQRGGAALTLMGHATDYMNGELNTNALILDGVGILTGETFNGIASIAKFNDPLVDIGTTSFDIGVDAMVDYLKPKLSNGEK